MIGSICKSHRRRARPAIAALPAVVLALPFAVGARSAPLPSPCMAATLDMSLGPTGAITHDSGPQALPLAGTTASACAATVRG
jgi:hypothetical protein